MRPLLIFLVSSLALIPAVSLADIACTPSKQLEEQHRPNMKRRSPPQNAKPIPTTVSEMAEWPMPGLLSQKKRFRRQDTPLDPREEQVYTVEGNLWRLKLADEDCDYHMEVGVAGGTKKDIRIVAEIPQAPAYAATREELLRSLKEAQELTPGQRITLKSSVPIRLTGYAFCDAQHYTPREPKRGKGHGTQFVATIWEIHPVWKIEFLDKKVAPKTVRRRGRENSKRKEP